eukprot:SAG22_NODE_4_length_44774_cov_362.122149_50_plen_86_part_00
MLHDLRRLTPRTVPCVAAGRCTFFFAIGVASLYGELFDEQHDGSGGAVADSEAVQEYIPAYLWILSGCFLGILFIVVGVAVGGMR